MFDLRLFTLAQVSSLQQPLNGAVRFRQDDVLINRPHDAVFHDDTTINNRRFHISTRRRVDDARDRIHVEGRIRVEVIEIENREVGFLADLETADLLLHADRASAADGRHAEDRLRIHRRRPVYRLLDKRSRNASR